HAGAFPAALDQLQVLIAAAAAADRLHLRIHVATTLEAGSLSFQATRRRFQAMRRRTALSHARRGLSQHKGATRGRPGTVAAGQCPKTRLTIKPLHGDHAETGLASAGIEAVKIPPRSPKGEHLCRTVRAHRPDRGDGPDADLR